MDKEAQLNLIAHILESYFHTGNVSLNLDTANVLYNYGYRKLPEGEPPLLSDEAIKKLGWGWMLNYDYELKDVLQAQRDSDIKWMRGL